MRQRTDCLFKDVPFGRVFYAFLDPNDPKDCHTLRCYKDECGRVHNPEFKSLELADSEPVYYYE